MILLCCFCSLALVGDSYRKISGDTCSGGDVEARLEGELVPCPLAGKRGGAPVWLLAHVEAQLQAPGSSNLAEKTHRDVAEVPFPSLSIQTGFLHSLFCLYEWKIFCIGSGFFFFLRAFPLFIENYFPRKYVAVSSGALRDVCSPVYVPWSVHQSWVSKHLWGSKELSGLFQFCHNYVLMEFYRF